MESARLLNPPSLTAEQGMEVTPICRNVGTACPLDLKNSSADFEVRIQYLINNYLNQEKEEVKKKKIEVYYYKNYPGRSLHFFTC